MVIALYIFKKEIKTNKVIMIKKNCLNSCSISNHKKNFFFFKNFLKSKIENYLKNSFFKLFFFFTF